MYILPTFDIAKVFSKEIMQVLWAVYEFVQNPKCQIKYFS